MKFFLGTHEPHWLGLLDVPLFVARGRLASRKSFPRARVGWALDSGGFSELTLHGRWTVTPQTYAAEVRRWRDEVGNLEWAAIQDWMCEPIVREKTGLSVEEHQRRTVQSYEDLQALAPDLPWTPVLQGWSVWDYLRHAEMYEARGHRLAAAPVVGVGTLCRRQATLKASLILNQLCDELPRLHGFGLKTQGLRSIGGERLFSADSMAWSYDARRSRPLPGHTHKNCANCAEYALQWRASLLDAIASPPPAQMPLALNEVAA
jgi:hypothetical protein